MVVSDGISSIAIWPLLGIFYFTRRTIMKLVSEFESGAIFDAFVMLAAAIGYAVVVALVVLGTGGG